MPIRDLLWGLLGSVWLFGIFVTVALFRLLDLATERVLLQQRIANIAFNIAEWAPSAANPANEQTNTQLEQILQELANIAECQRDLRDHTVRRL